MAPSIPAKSANGSVSKVDDHTGSKILTPTGNGSKNGMLNTISTISGGRIKAGRAAKDPIRRILERELLFATLKVEKRILSTINAIST